MDGSGAAGVGGGGRREHDEEGGGGRNDRLGRGDCWAACPYLINCLLSS